ncbi:TIGR03016 family PEP-CTERM system-associated outer membrane protein [Nitrosomonas sp.]|uniref:TIGR03016 family PEP-CTERM system-associated outer membrane protein n=1 Tax=Nitrosomonas sp. TaxID=42353 RepID=UPI001D9FE619|nr:TIGR03016 family PEP-CTERM system-associated outer membrane protein [Nitrosomonas sp.]MCB1947810.1 TIGR03016 family PEP-CTERM system-associated outer membrane protein [Nitrosomonas sp.]MDR4513453.1 TIGR03016 family PEP-CTERM system-associated outer membrane protein [Nitrosomonas sp.]
MNFSIKQGRDYLFIYFGAAVVFFLAHSLQVAAGELEFNPTLTVSETYTDNVRLGGGLIPGGGGGIGFGGAGSSGGDFITQINPGILFTGNGRRYDVNAQYVMNNLIFAQNTELTQIRHMLNANATTEVLKDLFFVDGDARILQQNVSLLAPQTANNVFATGNRANLEIYSVSPYLRHRFQNFASAEARYTRGYVKSGFSGFINSQRDSYQFILNSGSAFRKLAWGFNYDNNRIHLDGSNTTIGLERYIGNLRYNFTPRFGLTATGGYERNSIISIRGKPSSPTWTAGFVWAPNKRTDLQFSAGQRFFGDTYSATANYRTRLSTWQVLYIEDITTFNQQAGQFGALGGALNVLGGGVDAQNLLLGLNNFLTNRVFLQRRFNASVTLNGSRNDLTLNVFQLKRKPYTAEELDEELLGLPIFFNNTKQLGGNVSWRYRLTSRTNFNTNFSFIRFDFLSANSTNDNLFITANVTKEFFPDLIGMLQYQRIDRLSDIQSGSQDIDLSANAVSVSLTKNF